MAIRKIIWPSCLWIGLGLLLAAGLSGRPGQAAERDPSRTESVAGYFHRSPDDILGLRDLGFGYGEIVKILVIAEASRRPLPDLLERNRQGEGWGTLCRDLGLDPLAIKKQVDDVRLQLQIRTRPLGK